MACCGAYEPARSDEVVDGLVWGLFGSVSTMDLCTPFMPGWDKELLRPWGWWLNARECRDFLERLNDSERREGSRVSEWGEMQCEGRGEAVRMSIDG